MDLPVDGPCGLPNIADFNDQPTNPVIAGLMSWVDSTIGFGKATHMTATTVDGKSQSQANRVVFSTNRSLLLRNVYVQGEDVELLEAPHGMP